MDNYFQKGSYTPANGFKEGLKTVLRSAGTAVLIGTLVGGLWLGSTIHKKEKTKSSLQPLGFSEITQIERDADKSGEEVEHITRYLTSVNDSVMKILECRNTAHSAAYQKAQTEAKEADPKARSKEVKMFAQELQLRRDPKFAALQRHHYELRNHLPALPRYAKEALQRMDNFATAMHTLAGVNSNFEEAWEDEHDDEYRTETYIDIETSTDSEGHVTTTPVVRTRQVYDHTDHTYIFYRDIGERASRELDALIAAYPHLELKEKIRTTSKINTGGKMAAQKSRMNQKVIPTTEAEFFAIANTWYTGSTLKANLPEIKEKLNRLKSGADSWRRAKDTADTHYSYETSSSSDAGPYEFQVAEANLQNGRKMHELINEIIGSINYTQQNIPVLDQKIKELIDIEMYGKKGNSRRVSKEIINLSIDIYNKNIKNGFHLHQYNSSMVILLGLLGALGGGLLGLGVNKGIKKITGYEDY